MALPNPSFAVTVIVEVPVPAAIGEVALTVDWDALTAPALPVALKFTGEPAPVAWSVCVPLFVPSVQLVLAMPLALLVAVTGTSTITVTAKDGFGNAISGATVSL